MALPTSGAAWSSIVTWSNRTPDVDLSDNNADGDVVTLAKALVYARTGAAAKRTEVIAALDRARAQGTAQLNRALELGRGLGAYVLAADLVGYRTAEFESWVRLRKNAQQAGMSQVDCHERRPNNWGTWCGSSRVIADLYLGDTVDLARAVTVWQGWLGDRSKYAGFSYGGTEWQCSPSAPVGINASPCTKAGVEIGGVLPDDQRRGDREPPDITCENYVWEGLQGVTLAGAVLERAGRDFFGWSTRAVVRAFDWLDANGCNPGPDDAWSPYIVDHFAGTDHASGATAPGKGFGFADWLWP